MYGKVKRRTSTIIFYAKIKLFPNCISLQTSILLAASIVSLKTLCAFTLVSHTRSESLCLSGDFIWHFVTQVYTVSIRFQLIIPDILNVFSILINSVSYATIVPTFVAKSWCRQMVCSWAPFSVISVSEAPISFIYLLIYHLSTKTTCPVSEAKPLQKQAWCNDIG